MTGGTQDPDGREGSSGIFVLSLEQRRDRSGACQFPTQVWKAGQRRARTPHGGAERPPAAPASRPCARAARLGGCRYPTASAHVSTPQPCAAEGGSAVGAAQFGLERPTKPPPSPPPSSPSLSRILPSRCPPRPPPGPRRGEPQYAGAVTKAAVSSEDLKSAARAHWRSGPGKGGRASSPPAPAPLPPRPSLERRRRRPLLPPRPVAAESVFSPPPQPLQERGASGASVTEGRVHGGGPPAGPGLRGAWARPLGPAARPLR